MHALSVSKQMQQVNKSINFINVINKFDTYFKILVYRVRCDIEKITFYLQNLIFVIIFFIHSNLGLKDKKKVKPINIIEWFTAFL